eukprot:2454235-Heterocapsa_arctica.AAC.1
MPGERGGRTICGCWSGDMLENATERYQADLQHHRHPREKRGHWSSCHRFQRSRGNSTRRRAETTALGSELL